MFLHPEACFFLDAVKDPWDAWIPAANPTSPDGLIGCCPLGRLNDPIFSNSLRPYENIVQNQISSLLDPRVVGQEEQLSCHPLCPILAGKIGKKIIFFYH